MMQMTTNTNQMAALGVLLISAVAMLAWPSVSPRLQGPWKMTIAVFVRLARHVRERRQYDVGARD